MPIEIKELYIKAVVSDTTKRETKPAEVDLSKIKRELVKECVQEVLQKMKEKNER
jgi:hypothetical protein